MKMHLLGRHAMYLAFSDGNPMKHRDSLFLYPWRKTAVVNELLNLEESASVLVLMMMVMPVRFVIVTMLFLMMSVAMAVTIAMFLFLVAVRMRMRYHFTAGELMRVLVLVLMAAFVFMLMTMAMMMIFVLMFITIISVFITVAVIMVMSQMNVEFRALNRLLCGATHVNVKFVVQTKLGQLGFQLLRVHPQVDQSANEHVAADAAENIEI
jgi:hypothetical protein